MAYTYTYTYDSSTTHKRRFTYNIILLYNDEKIIFLSIKITVGIGKI